MCLPWAHLLGCQVGDNTSEKHFEKEKGKKKKPKPNQFKSGPDYKYFSGDARAKTHQRPRHRLLAAPPPWRRTPGLGAASAVPGQDRRGGGRRGSRAVRTGRGPAATRPLPRGGGGSVCSAAAPPKAPRHHPPARPLSAAGSFPPPHSPGPALASGGDPTSAPGVGAGPARPGPVGQRRGRAGPARAAAASPSPGEPRLVRPLPSSLAAPWSGAGRRRAAMSPCARPSCRPTPTTAGS